MYCPKCNEFVEHNHSACPYCNKALVEYLVNYKNRGKVIIPEPKEIIEKYPNDRIESLRNSEIPSEFVNKLSSRNLFGDWLYLKEGDEEDEKFQYKIVESFSGEKHASGSSINDKIDYSGIRHDILLWKKFGYEEIAIRRRSISKKTMYKKAGTGVTTRENYSIFYDMVFLRRQKDLPSLNKYKELEIEYLKYQKIYPVMTLFPYGWGQLTTLFLFTILLPITLLIIIIKFFLNKKNMEKNNQNKINRIRILNKLDTINIKEEKETKDTLEEYFSNIKQLVGSKSKSGKEIGVQYFIKNIVWVNNLNQELPNNEFVVFLNMKDINNKSDLNSYILNELEAKYSTKIVRLEYDLNDIQLVTLAE